MYKRQPRDLENEEDVKLMLLLLAESICSRMRELVSRCTVVEIYVRDTELNSFSRQRKLAAPSCSSQALAETGLDIFRRNYRWDRPIRSIGPVSYTHLDVYKRQIQQDRAGRGNPSQP